jgi:hypothetical protein
MKFNFHSFENINSTEKNRIRITSTKKEEEHFFNAIFIYIISAKSSLNSAKRTSIV